MACQITLVVLANFLVHQVSMDIYISFWKRVHSPNITTQTHPGTADRTISCIVRNSLCLTVLESTESCVCCPQDVSNFTKKTGYNVYVRTTDKSDSRNIPKFTTIESTCSPSISILHSEDKKIAKNETTDSPATKQTIPGLLSSATSPSPSPQTSSATSRKPKCKGLECCKCGRVVTKVMKNNNSTKGFYILKEEKTTSLYVLSWKINKLVPLRLKLKKGVLLYKVSTPLCMSIFLRADLTLCGACLDGKGKRKLLRPINGINEILLDTKLKVILYLTNSPPVWKSIDFMGGNEKTVVKVKTTQIIASIDDQSHTMYWMILLSGKLYQYDYINDRGPRYLHVDMVSPLFPVFFHVGFRKKKRIIGWCTESKFFTMMDMKTKIKKRVPLTYHCARVCYADAVWYMINKPKTRIQTYNSVTDRLRKWNALSSSSDGLKECSAG